MDEALAKLLNPDLITSAGVVSVVSPHPTAPHSPPPSVLPANAQAHRNHTVCSPTQIVCVRACVREDRRLLYFCRQSSSS